MVREVVTGTGGEVLEETVEWFAQYRAGNVWSFGSEGVWETGVDGARAGLAMPASPRLGDGYQQELAPGVAEDRAEVLALDGTAQVGSGTYDDLLVTEDTSPLAPDLVQRTFYAPGTGPVLVETTSGGEERVELVSFTPGEDT